MTYEPPEHLNVAQHFLDARVREGRGGRPALRTPDETLTYADVLALANRYAWVLSGSGVEPEHRVMLALSDGPAFVAAFFATLKLGAVVVMVNPGLPDTEVRAFLEYTRARVVVTHGEAAVKFRAAGHGLAFRNTVLVVDEPEMADRTAAASPEFDTFDSHRDDAAVWLFSGGTTGRPKAVVQSHRSFAHTAACYARDVIGYTEADVTLSVPKLYFGYATGSNLLFPFAAGATAALYPEPATADTVFAHIRRFRPTVLVNVPTMINRMVSHPEAASQDLSSIRICTSAGEALPVELHERWTKTFGVELLDGLGTAEMWHIFISNRPGGARPGTLGQVVPGFEVKVCDEEGRPVPAGETGWLWVRGGARATTYWQNLERTQQAFRGEWYVSGDLVQMDAHGFVTYQGRGDEMLKVSGRWLSPADVESCLLQHSAVAEVAVVGASDAGGLVKPVAFVVPRQRRTGLEEELQAFVRDRLEPYKYPRQVFFIDSLPRTHLGKVDRGKLRRQA